MTGQIPVQYVKINMKRIKVRLIPNAKKFKLVQIEENVFRIWITEKPLENKANEALIKILADHYKIAKTNFRIIAGERGRDKVIEIL